MPSSLDSLASPEPIGDPVSSGLISVDLALRLIDLDPGLAGLLGLSADQCRGLPLAAALPAWGAALEPALRKALVTAAPIPALALPPDLARPPAAQQPFEASLYQALLQIVTAEARALLGARRASASMTAEPHWRQVITAATGPAEGELRQLDEAPGARPDIAAPVGQLSRPLRLGQGRLLQRLIANLMDVTRLGAGRLRLDDSTKGIVERHGGTVEAASGGAGQGATFTVRLPLAPPSGA